MKNLKNYAENEIVRLIQEKWITEDDLYESGICPVCFNQAHNHILYGHDMLLYEDDDLVCFFDKHPRAEGHLVISSKKHFSDLSEIDSDVCQRIISFTQKAMLYLKRVYNAESVYLCSISDGSVSHFQLQLIPRYHYEKSGSDNFVKHRKPYSEDMEKIMKMRSLLS